MRKFGVGEESLREEIKDELFGRISITIFYGFICALALHRCILFLSGRARADELSNWQIALYAGFAFSSWSLTERFRLASDRIAAFLFGLFYAIRVVPSIMRAVDPFFAVVGGGIVISVGMIAIVVGLKQAV